MIRPLTGTIFAFLILTLLCAGSGFAENFDDIGGHNAARDIAILSGRGIIGGYPDGTFRPEGLVSRAEFASIIVRGVEKELPLSPETPSFNDVPTDHWAFPYVEAAKSYDLVTGTPNGRYLPDDYITRLDVMVMLAKAADLPLPSKKSAGRILDTFIDGTDVPRWARQHVAAVVQQGIFANYPNDKLIEPELSASRATVAMMTRRALLPDALDDRTAWQATPSLARASVPASREFEAVLTDPLSSEMSRRGEAVTVRLAEALSEEIPEGSRMMGRIEKIYPVGSRLRHGVIELGFHTLVLPGGARIPVEAAVASPDALLRGFQLLNDGEESVGPPSKKGVPVSLSEGDVLRLKLMEPITIPEVSR